MATKEETFAAGQQAYKSKLDSSSRSGLRAWMFFAAFFGITIVLLQGSWYPKIPFFSNVYIPDSMTLFHGTLSTVAIDWAKPFESSSIGLRLLYGPFKLVDPRVLFIPNLAMWLGCIWAAYRIFAPINVRAAQFAVVAIIFNPYLLLGLSGPTKEMPLTLLVLLFLLIEPSWKHLPQLAAVVVLTYFIRDGYAYIMLAWLGLHVFLPRITWRPGRIVLCLVPLLILLLFRTYEAPLNVFAQFENEARWIDSPSDVGSQNIKRALESLDDPWLTTREYGFRISANGFSALIRPSLTTISNRISLLGLGFLVHGYFLASGLAAVILTCFLPYEDERLQYLAWFVVLVWAVVSLVLFIQPRYLMPITPVAMGVLGSRAPVTRTLIIVVMLVASLVGFFVLTYGLDINPLMSVDNPVKPPFFFGGD